MVQKAGNVLGLFETVGLWVSLSSIAALAVALILTSRKPSHALGQEGIV